MIYFIIFLIVVIIAFIVYFFILQREGRTLKQVQAKIQDTNAARDSLLERLASLKEQVAQLSNIPKEYQQKKNEIAILQDTIETLKSNKEKILQDISSIEERYSLAEDEAQEAYLNLLKDKKDEVLSINSEIADVYSKLQAARRTFQATIKVTEKDNTDCRTLNLNSSTLADLALLNSIRSKLIKSDALDKVFWDIYFKVPTKELTKGTEKKCGIYKIENLITHQCYIGQSVDVAVRWTSHIKNAIAAMGKSSPNKLYSNMAEYGLNNFSFTIVEECGRELLNEKEKFWIDFTNSKEQGLNSTSGNN